MHSKFLKYLRCPKTRKKLKLDTTEVRKSGYVVSGSLSTSSTTYPIINGIPRFVDAEKYADSFGFEWTRFPDLQFDRNNLSTEFEGYTEEMFFKATGFSKDEIKGKTIVEFGCGAGRFLDVIRKRGGIAIGMDLSAAVESARRNFQEDTDVLIVQGDILDPPFVDDSFDAGYSIGVLHHTPAPPKGVHALVRSVKHGGEIGICVYDKESGYNSPAIFWYRKFFTVMKKKFGIKVGLQLALGYSYAAAYFFHFILKGLQKIPFLGPSLASFIRYFFIASSDLSEARWRTLDTFDSITPEFASTHTPLEVSFWLQSAGCSEVSQQPWGSGAFRGTKTQPKTTEAIE